jgi:dethiobiotin synthetase
VITRFITATGTGLGKTLVTAALCHQLRRMGRTVRALKPLVTGFDETSWADSDPAVLLKGLGKWPSFETPAAQASRRMGEDLDSIAPFRFAAPLAPSMAAAQEGRAVDLDAVVGFCRAAMAGPDEVLLIEGVGGVMAPLAAGITVLDWIKALACPAILVTGSYLGSLSHSLTALAVLRAAAVPLAGVVVSESADSTVSLEDTVAELMTWTDAPILALPRLTGPEPWQNAPPLTRLA